MVSDVVPLQFAWIQEPLATCRTLVGQNLWESFAFQVGERGGTDGEDCGMYYLLVRCHVTMQVVSLCERLSALIALVRVRRLF